MPDKIISAISHAVNSSFSMKDRSRTENAVPAYGQHLLLCRPLFQAFAFQDSLASAGFLLHHGADFQRKSE